MAQVAGAEGLRDLDAAHRALLQHSDLQFQLTPPPVFKPPFWLKFIEPLFKALAPVLPYVFWACLILGAATILIFVAREMLSRRRDPVRWRANLGAESGDWRPAPEQARMLLADADRLAEQGRFEEAAHLILLRSIEDIQDRRPRLVRPALTSRDIGRLPGLPEAARETFVGIAEAVERSLFGGRSLDREAFVRCRQAYEAFVAGAWS
jgi:hypothetical protein